MMHRMSTDPISQIQAVEVRSAELEVYEALRWEIIHGLPAGTQLRLRDLAARFTVSTMPVRAAIARLEIEGFVTTRPRRGAVVTELTQADYDDMYAIRVALECSAAAAGAVKLGEAGVATMRGYLTSMKALKLGDPELLDNYLPLHWKLHDVCYEAGGHPKLLRLIHTYRRYAERYFRLALGNDVDLASDIAGQEKFVDACAANDSAAAQVAVADLFAWMTDLVIPALDDGPTTPGRVEPSPRP